MAEGFARELGKEIIEPYSAGLIATMVHPMAIRVMKEEGIDISNQRSKEIDEGLLHEMDIVITLCTHAENSCPLTPPHIRRLLWPIDDPVGATGTEEEIIQAFRKTRDEIKNRIIEFLERLKVSKDT